MIRRLFCVFIVVTPLLFAGCGGKGDSESPCVKGIKLVQDCVKELCAQPDSPQNHYEKKKFCGDTTPFDAPELKTCNEKCAKAFQRGLLDNKRLDSCKRKINGFGNALSLGCK